MCYDLRMTRNEAATEANRLDRLRRERRVNGHWVTQRIAFLRKLART
jgi:hypothetical protein